MKYLLPKLFIQILLLAVKLDGASINWVWVLCPIWGSILDIMLLNIAGHIVHTIKTNKRDAKFQTAFGNRLVWDAKTQTMCGAPESEDNTNA